MSDDLADSPWFEQNLALLKKYHPAAWKLVEDYKGGLVGVLDKSADGNPNLKILGDDGREILLHDPVSTAAELPSYYSLVSEKSPGVAIFIGMGLGYTPTSILLDRPELRFVVVFEPELGIFLQALRARDLRQFLQNKKVILAVGPAVELKNVLVPLQSVMQLENIHILKHTPCFKFSILYQQVHDQVYEFANVLNMHGNTMSFYGEKFVANRIKNMYGMHHHLLLDSLYGEFENIPAILVAGGPSLDKNVDLLRQAEGKALIIAADRALPALAAHGVKADFVTCIDMLEVVLEKMVGVADHFSDAALVCNAWVNPLVPKIFPARQIYWSFTAKNSENWLSKSLGGKYLTSGSSTVAHLSLNVALVLGCSPIIYTGQDLAFSGGKLHAAHTWLTATNQSDQEEMGKTVDVLTVDAYGGGSVATSRQFLSYKHQFEKMMASSDRKFINSTEGGVRLAGTEELPLRDALARHCKKPVPVAEIISRAEFGRSDGKSIYFTEVNALHKKAESVLRDLSNFETTVSKVKQRTAGLSPDKVRGFVGLPKPVQKLIGEMDKLALKLDNEGLWLLLDEVFSEGIRQSDLLEQEISRLAGQPKLYLLWVTKSVQKLEMVNKFRRNALEPFVKLLHELGRFISREKALLDQLTSNKSSPSRFADVAELLALYYDIGDMVRLERVLAVYAQEAEVSGDSHFYRGAVAAHRCQFEKMEQHFAHALELSKDQGEDRIRNCLELLANRYLAYATEFPHLRQSMLFKAVRFDKKNESLITLLETESDTVIAAMEAVSRGEAQSGAADLLATWCREMTLNHDLSTLLGPVRSAALHRLYGLHLLSEEHFAEAGREFARATEHLPADPQNHLLLADAAFAADDYATGINALDQAVTLDRSCAENWETIGDTLLSADQPQEALVAYEKCFIALPERIDLLKKMGDCYQALNQPEAALAAYQQLAQRLSGSETGSV